MLSKKDIYIKARSPAEAPELGTGSTTSPWLLLHTPRDTRVAPSWHSTPPRHPLPDPRPSPATLGIPQRQAALLRGGSAGGEAIPMERKPRQLCLFLTWLQALGTEWHQVIFILMRPLPRCDTALDAPPRWAQSAQDGHGRSCPAQPQPYPGLSQHPALSMLLTSCITSDPWLEPDHSLVAKLSHLLSHWEEICAPGSLPHTTSLPEKPRNHPREPRWSQVFLPLLATLPQLWTLPRRQPRSHPAPLSCAHPHPTPGSLRSGTGAGSFPIIAVSAEFTASLRVINNNGLTLK